MIDQEFNLDRKGTIAAFSEGSPHSRDDIEDALDAYAAMEASVSKIDRHKLDKMFAALFSISSSFVIEVETGGGGESLQNIFENLRNAIYQMGESEIMPGIRLAEKE